MPLLRFYRWLTGALGDHRRLIRRIAALCLIIMGMHQAADHLDDLVYRVLDVVDLVCDDAVTGALVWLSDIGLVEPVDAARMSESFGAFVDLAEKDTLAMALALVVELAIDVMLLEFVWGRHEDDEWQGVVHSLKQCALQMANAFRDRDLERLAVMPVLVCLALAGATSAALAMEQVTRATLQRSAPDLSWSGPLAADAGILAAVVLVWRFLPDLLHGALLRSRVRHDVAQEEATHDLLRPHRFPRLSYWIIRLRLGSRGTWLFVLALPLALGGLFSRDLLGLLERADLVP